MPKLTRTVERGRGCYNCTRFQTGDVAQKYYRDRMAAEAGDQSPITRLADMEKLDIQSRTQQFINRGYSDKVAQRMAERAIAEELVADAASPVKSRDARYKVFDKMINTGAVGMCLAGKIKSDFVHYAYFCDGWTARDGASVATEGHKPDLLPEELKEMVDGSVTADNTANDLKPKA